MNRSENQFAFLRGNDKADSGHLSFASTHWSVVLLAGHGNTERSQEALAQLCQTYWYPLYVFVRRQGYESHNAEDLTQEFFVRLLASDDLARVRPEKGRFRCYLLASLKHFLLNEWKRARRLKRGGGQTVISFDAARAEARYVAEPASDLTPDRIYERRWATTLLEQTIARLREEHAANGRLDFFEALKDALTGEESTATYAELGQRLGLRAAAVKMAVYRLRRRYREILREEIAHTVASPDEVDDELRHLFSALS
jgi:RNA polymerase sigma factor (sigma-70 family)